MKVTFILKDLSDVFYNGNQSSDPNWLIVGLNELSDRKKLDHLFNKRGDHLGITSKIGSCNAFRDMVDMNSMLKEECHVTYKLEPRRGYKLATFEVTRAGKQKAA